MLTSFGEVQYHCHRVDLFFRYGVNDMSANPAIESDITDTTRIAPHKSMPTILSRILSTFRLENCMYRVNKQKEGTGRVVMHRRLKVPCVPLSQSICSLSHFTQILLHT
jgi:hypothetical protein